MNKYFLFLSPVIFLLLSCADEDMTFDIGSDKIEVEANMGFIDTMTVNSFTVVLDSLPTSKMQVPSIVVGKYPDAMVGTITSTSYFLMDVPSGTDNNKVSVNKNAILDSIKLYMVYDGYYAGDTLLPCKIRVHRLKEPLEPGNDNLFYNNDTLAAFAETFGEVTFRPRPASGDSVWIPLNQEFGNTLLGYLKTSDPVVTGRLDWLNFFKGMAVTWDPMDKILVGFKFPIDGGAGAPAIRLFYHYIDNGIIKKVIELKPEPRQLVLPEPISLQFNSFALTNAVVNFQNQPGKIPSALTGNKTYAVAGLGIVTRFEFPHLKNLLLFNDKIRIVDARLQIEPVYNSYSRKLPLPEELGIYETDRFNNWGLLIENKYGGNQNGDLAKHVDYLNNEETWYSFDITNFLEDKLYEQTDEVPSILLTIPAENLYKTADRVIMGNMNHTQNKVKLKIYYMTIE